MSSDSGEPETATRVLFAPAGGVHGRFVEANKRLMEEVRAEPALDVADRAARAVLSAE